jgi:hypothetical protein
LQELTHSLSSAGITAIVKSYFITGTARSADFTFSSADLLIWSASETAVTIMAASLPFLRLIIKEISQATRLARARGAGNTQQDGGKNSGGIQGKYETLDDDWIAGASSADGGPRRGRLVMQDGKATVTYQ